VLSFDTTRTLTGRLLQAEADADARGWAGPPVLLVLHDQPYTQPGSRHRLRRMRAASFTLDPADVAARAAGIPAVLHDLADQLMLTNPRNGGPSAADHEHPDAPTRTAAGTTARPGPGADRGIAGGQITAGMLTAPATARLLAWAVLYEDVDADPAGIAEVRRVDAVDIDGRVYQLTRRRGEPHVVVAVDDHPDPGDTPATHPGLTALLATTGRLPHHDTRAGTRP